MGKIRNWKETPVVRSSSVKTKILRPGWAKQQEIRTTLKITKTIEREMKATTSAEKQRIREQQAINKLRKEENEKKSRITQSFSSNKVKRMAKKQHRQLIKTN